MARKKEILQNRVRSIQGKPFTDTPWWSRSEGGPIETRTKRNMERLDINQEWRERERRREYIKNNPYPRKA